jgi:hypothetical protein
VITYTFLALGAAGVWYCGLGIFRVASELNKLRNVYEEKNRWIKSKGPGSYSPSSDA